MNVLTRVTTVVPPAVTPVDLDLACRHARIDSDSSDSLVSLYVASATEMAERYLNRVLITQTVKFDIAQANTVSSGWNLTNWNAVVYPLSLDFLFRNGGRRWVELPRNPVQSVSSVTITDIAGNDTVLTAGTDYTVALGSEPARVIFTGTTNMMTAQNISIRYVAGYGTTPSTIPANIRNAILIGTTTLYEHRGDQEAGELPSAFFRLLDPHRLYGFA